MGQQLQKIGHVVSIDINLLRGFGAMLVGGHRPVPHGKFWAWFISIYIKESTLFSNVMHDWGNCKVHEKGNVWAHADGQDAGYRHGWGTIAVMGRQ